MHEARREIPQIAAEAQEEVRGQGNILDRDQCSALEGVLTPQRLAEEAKREFQKVPRSGVNRLSRES